MKVPIDRGTVRLRLLPRLLLLLGVTFQLIYLASHDLPGPMRRMWRARGEEARERSVRLGFGADVSEYVDFLRGVVPEDALVVIPPASQDPVLAHMGLMQYFLFPRRLTNCPSLEEWGRCRDLYERGRAYFVSLDGFPPEDGANETMVYIAFDAGRGVFSPRTGLSP